LLKRFERLAEGELDLVVLDVFEVGSEWSIVEGIKPLPGGGL
jgi:hypothetical protein